MIADGISADPVGFSAHTQIPFSENRVEVVYFGAAFRISLESMRFEPDSISDYEKLFVLHYLTGVVTDFNKISRDGETRQPTSARIEYATFQSLPSGMFYYGPFRKRSIDRLLPVFGSDPDLLRKAATLLGGIKAEYGEVGYRFSVLPKISVVIALHVGDDEFPPEIKLLFPRNVTTYLTLEDVAVLGGLIAGKLLRAARD